MDYRVVLLSKTLHEQLLWDSRIPSESRTIAKPVLKREINNIDTFSFTVYKTHPLYDKLTPYNGWVAVKKNGKVKFIGKITQAPDNIRHEKQVQCEGGLALLKHSAYSRYMPNWCPKAYDKKVSPFSVTDGVEKMVNRVLDIHNAQVYEGTAEKWEDGFPCVRLGACTARENPYGVDLVKSAGNEGTQNEGLYITRDQTSCTTPYDWLTSEVCDKCAAYAIIDVGDDYSLTLNIYGAKELPANMTTPIRFEKNLLDMSLDVDFSDVCTVFLPLGESNSNVGTLLGNKVGANVEGLGNIDLSLGGILKSAFDGTLDSDIEDVVDESMSAATVDVNTETTYNTIECNGSSSDIMADAAPVYATTEAYDNRADQSQKLVIPDDGAVLVTYYKEYHPSVEIYAVGNDVSYLMYKGVGYVDPSDDDGIIHMTAESPEYLAVDVQYICKATNCYVGSFDLSVPTHPLMDTGHIVQMRSREATIEIWRQKQLSRNDMWVYVRGLKRSPYLHDNENHQYVSTVSPLSGSDISNQVLAIVSDIESTGYTGTFGGVASGASSSKDKAMFRLSKDRLADAVALDEKMFYCFVMRNGITPIIDGTAEDPYVYVLSDGAQLDVDLENHFLMLPAGNAITVMATSISNINDVGNHLKVVDVGDNGLGWVKTINNNEVVQDASSDGVTIRANFPYLEWVEGIERYGRIVKTHTWSSARRSQLRQYAPVYFRQKILEAETINANAVDIGLSDIETGMSYKVICEQMGKKQWYPCLKSEENLMDPTKNKFTFTYKHPTFTQEVMKIAKNVSSANRRLPATVLKSVGGVALSENPQ